MGTTKSKKKLPWDTINEPLGAGEKFLGKET